MGFNGLNRCFDFGLVGPISYRTYLVGLVRPKQPLWNRSWPFGLVGGLLGMGSPPYREGLGGALVA